MIMETKRQQCYILVYSVHVYHYTIIITYTFLGFSFGIVPRVFDALRFVARAV